MGFDTECKVFDTVGDGLDGSTKIFDPLRPYSPLVFDQYNGERIHVGSVIGSIRTQTAVSAVGSGANKNIFDEIVVELRLPSEIHRFRHHTLTAIFALLQDDRLLLRLKRVKPNEEDLKIGNVSHAYAVDLTQKIGDNYDDGDRNGTLDGRIEASALDRITTSIGRLYFLANSKSLWSCAGTAITAPVPYSIKT